MSRGNHRFDFERSEMKNLFRFYCVFNVQRSGIFHAEHPRLKRDFGQLGDRIFSDIALDCRKEVSYERNTVQMVNVRVRDQECSDIEFPFFDFAASVLHIKKELLMLLDQQTF